MWVLIDPVWDSVTTELDSRTKRGPRSVVRHGAPRLTSVLECRARRLTLKLKCDACRLVFELEHGAHWFTLKLRRNATQDPI